MGARIHRKVVVLAAGAMLLSRSAAGQATFAFVGGTDADVGGISGNGAWSVGFEVFANAAHPYRWNTQTLVGEELGLIAGFTAAKAIAVSADGDVVLCRAGINTSGPFASYRWKAGAGLAAFPAGAAAWGLSPDGRVAVGNQSLQQAALWVDVDGPGPFAALLLPPLRFGSTDYALATSADYAAVVGLSTSGECTSPARWTSGIGGPDVVSCGGGSGDAIAITPDGMTIVGCTAQCDFFGGRGGAGMWTNGQCEALGTLPGSLAADATGVSTDGSVVVGYAYVGQYSHQPVGAFVWTRSTGMLDIPALVRAEGGTVPTGILWTAQGVSGDGRVVVGTALFPAASSYARRAWKVTLPPGTFDGLLTSPANGATDVPEPVVLRWSAAPGATRYAVRWRVGNGAEEAAFVTGTSLTLPVTPAFRCVDVTWRVSVVTIQAEAPLRPASRTFRTRHPAEFDGNGELNVTDIFAYLNAWFAQWPSADIDGGGVMISDLFDYLGLWFGGCQ